MAVIRIKERKFKHTSSSKDQPLSTQPKEKRKKERKSPTKC
jgi:hypothetical protein